MNNANVPYESIYRSLYRIRRVEEEVARVYPTDKIKSPIHLSIGQEAVSVGLCEALEPRDIVFGTYRGHALYLAKNGDLKKMIAELYGKATGCAKGKGGSMHLIDVNAGAMGASAVVATAIPHAVGYALALKYKKSDAIVANVFGDGAVDEGAFHESLNFAALKHLPIIFVCENNHYSIHAHQLTRQHSSNVCERAAAYGIPAERVEGNDVVGIYERVREAARTIREGSSGPRFFECMTYRWMEHVGPSEDFHAGYRTREEAEPWIASDPMRKIGEALDPEARAAVDAEVEAEIAEAFRFAESSPLPDAAELFTDMFKESEWSA